MTPNPSTDTGHSCRRTWLLLLTGMFLIHSGCASLSPQEPAATQSPVAVGTNATDWNYTLFIDASSSSSTLQVFQWRPRSGGRLPQIESAPFPRDSHTKGWERRVKPGLGDYGGRPEEAARSLEPLIDYALSRIGTDPAALSRTTLYLRATAGMRLLPEKQQLDILSAVQEYFDGLELAESSARVIGGDEEGIYGWIAVNYILGHLEHGGPFPTVGALDLGGASTQVTFVPLDYPKHHGRPIAIGRNTYHLYTHSYLGLGQDQAREKVASPACFISGYPIPGGGVGTGDLSQCRSAIRAAFADECDDEPCPLFGTYQPPLYGDFMAFSVYAYAADFFQLNERLIPDVLANEGSAFCAQEWSDIVARDPEAADNPYLPTYCYAAAHIATLLTDGFGFAGDTTRITAPLRVQGTNVGWALGALVYEIAGTGD